MSVGFVGVAGKNVVVGCAGGVNQVREDIRRVIKRLVAQVDPGKR